MKQDIDSIAVGKRILVVDDDRIFTAMAVARLTVDGHEVHVASNGVQALNILDREVFDIAVVDLVMPQIDGFRLLALLRGSPRMRGMAIIVVSARHDEVAFREALALGADGYLTKPVNWESFPESVLSVLTERTAILMQASAAPARCHAAR